MNQRLTAGLLVGISIAFIGAELLVAVFGSFDQGWMVLFLSLYAGFVGLLFGLRTLSEGRREEVESVSERRARARRDGLVGNLLDDYEIDEEFLGRGKRKFSSSKPATSQPSASPSSGASGDRPLDDEELKSAVIAHADMMGGLASLRARIEAMDDLDFYSMARKVGMAGVSRTRALAVVTELVSASGGAMSDEASPLSLSIDKESFDDYIKRCMSNPDTRVDDEANDSGSFSVGLDAGDLSSRPGTPPTEFSHDPKAVIERFKRSAGKR
jgi:hypothetical protein